MVIKYRLLVKYNTFALCSIEFRCALILRFNMTRFQGGAQHILSQEAVVMSRE